MIRRTELNVYLHKIKVTLASLIKQYNLASHVPVIVK